MSAKSQAQVKERVQAVFEMMCESKSTVTIYKEIGDKYMVNQATAKRYIQRAHKLLDEHLSSKRDVMLNKALLQKEHIIEKLMKTKNYAMASQALADKNKLEGLYDDTGVDPSVNITIIQD